jgi:hypothetical protein
MMFWCHHCEKIPDRVTQFYPADLSVLYFVECHGERTQYQVTMGELLLYPEREAVVFRTGQLSFPFMYE